MNHQWIIITIALSSFILFAMGLAAIFQRRLLNGYGFPMLMFCAAIYSIAYAFELTADTIDQAFMCLRIEYIGISFLSTFWLITALQCTNSHRYLKRTLLIPLFTVSFLTFFIMQTTLYTGLHYEKLDLLTVGGLSITQITRGPWYYFFTVYQYSMLIMGTLVLALKYRYAEVRLKEQYLILLLGSLVYGIAHLFYFLGYVPYNLDIGPVTLCVTAATFLIGMNREKLIHIVNKAQRHVFNGLPDAIVIVTPDLHILDFNPLFNSLFCPITNQIVGVSLANLLDSNHDLIDFAQTHESGQFKFMIHHNDQDETHYVATMSGLYNKKGKLHGKVISFRDVTIEEDQLKRLNELAHFDYLTGILNRHAFYEALPIQINSQPINTGLAFISIDIDHFKQINDEFGHIIGDFVLCNFVTTIKSHLPDQSLFARFGGEEFVVTVPCEDMSSAHALASHLQHFIASTPVPCESYLINLTASFGVSFSHDVTLETVDTLLRQSDTALYLAKERGRNRVELA